MLRNKRIVSLFLALMLVFALGISVHASSYSKNATVNGSGELNAYLDGDNQPARMQIYIYTQDHGRIKYTVCGEDLIKFEMDDINVFKWTKVRVRYYVNGNRLDDVEIYN